MDGLKSLIFKLNIIEICRGESMVFKFLTWLKANVSSENFKDILAAADQDIKFNRVSFGKRTSPIKYIDICTKCANVILRGGEKIEYLSNN